MPFKRDDGTGTEETFQFCKIHKTGGSSNRRQGRRLIWEGGFFIEHGWYKTYSNLNTATPTYANGSLQRGTDPGINLTISFAFGTPGNPNNGASVLYGAIVNPNPWGSNNDFPPNAFLTGYSNVNHTNWFGHEAEMEVVHSLYHDRSAVSNTNPRHSYFVWGKY